MKSLFLLLFISQLSMSQEYYADGLLVEAQKEIHLNAKSKKRINIQDLIESVIVKRTEDFSQGKKVKLDHVKNFLSSSPDGYQFEVIFDRERKYGCSFGSFYMYDDNTHSFKMYKFRKNFKDENFLQLMAIVSKEDKYCGTILKESLKKYILAMESDIPGIFEREMNCIEDNKFSPNSYCGLAVNFSIEPRIFDRGLATPKIDPRVLSTIRRPGKELGSPNNQQTNKSGTINN